MMPGAAALAINQVQLWNECNKMAIFGGAGGMRFHVISLNGSTVRNTRRTEPFDTVR